MSGDKQQYVKTYVLSNGRYLVLHVHDNSLELYAYKDGKALGGQTATVETWYRLVTTKGEDDPTYL